MVGAAKKALQEKWGKDEEVCSVTVEEIRVVLCAALAVALKEVMSNEPPKHDRSQPGANVNGAPQKEPQDDAEFLLETAKNHGTYEGMARLKAIAGKLAGADAAQPVAWRWELSGSGDPVRLGIHKPSGNVTNLQPLYAHPEDENDYLRVVNKFDMCRAALARRYKADTGKEPTPPDDDNRAWHEWLIEQSDGLAHPEDAPAGPWYVIHYSTNEWRVVYTPTGKTRFRGTKAEANAVRDKLNSLTSKGEKK